MACMLVMHGRAWTVGLVLIVAAAGHTCWLLEVCLLGFQCRYNKYSAAMSIGPTVERSKHCSSSMYLSIATSRMDPASLLIDYDGRQQHSCHGACHAPNHNTRGGMHTVLYNPSGIVLSETQQIVLTNLE